MNDSLHLATQRQEIPPPPRKHSHWIVFLVVCFLLGLLVFKAVLHMIGTDTKQAHRVHAPSPVETVPVRKQTLEEVIGGSGTIEQFNAILLTSQINARVLEVPVKIGDIVKKGDLLVRLDDRVIRATLESNRQLVEANDVKIRDLTSQLSRYTALLKKNMDTQLDEEKSAITLTDARETPGKASQTLQ